MIAVLFLLALLLEWHILDVVDVNPVSSLMNFEFLQTLHGFINLLQVVRCSIYTSLTFHTFVQFYSAQSKNEAYNCLRYRTLE